MARRRQITDEEVLAGARTCFLDQGPAVSTTFIAEHLGISQGVLFQRFKTKEGLMLAAMAPPSRPDWIDAADQGPCSDDFQGELLQILERLQVFLDELMPRMVVLLAAGIKPEHLLARYQTPPPVLGIRALTGWLRRAQERGLAAHEDPEHLALVLLSGVHGLTFFRHILGKAAPKIGKEDYLQSLTSLVARVVAPRRAL